MIKEGVFIPDSWFSDGNTEISVLTEMLDIHSERIYSAEAALSKIQISVKAAVLLFIETHSSALPEPQRVMQDLAQRAVAMIEEGAKGAFSFVVDLITEEGKIPTVFGHPIEVVEGQLGFLKPVDTNAD